MVNYKVFIQLNECLENKYFWGFRGKENKSF